MSGFEKSVMWVVMIGVLVNLIGLNLKMDAVVSVFREIAVEVKK